MAVHHDKGKQGEEYAARMLEEKGYVLLERNWRFKKGELDIIAMQNDIVVFAEVKTRSTEQYGYPEFAVTVKKQQLIAATAEAYLYEKQMQNSIRFDIISVIINNSGIEMHHFEDAFFPNPADDLE